MAHLRGVIRSPGIRRTIATLVITVLSAIAAVGLTVSCAFTHHAVVNAGTPDQQRVTLTFAQLSRHWCGPGIVTIVGVPMPIMSGLFCSPIRPEITLPATVNFGVSVSSAATPKTVSQKAPRITSQTARAKGGGITGKLMRESNTGPEQAISQADARMRSGVHAVTSNLVLWFRIWAYVFGTLECIAFANVAVIVLSALAQLVLRVRLSAVRKCLMVTAVGCVWLGLATSSSIAASQVADNTTLTQVFGASVDKVGVEPAGPVDTRSQGATIGNSINSFRGGAGGKAPCYQATMAMAKILSTALGVPVKELDCSGATIDHGLLGPQWFKTGHKVWGIKPQLDYLMQMKSLRFVDVTDGEDELNWSQLIGSCYVDNACASNAIAGIFAQSLNQFAIAYNELLSALAALPMHPKILVNLSYNPFTAQAQVTGSQCAATGSLTGPDVRALANMSQQLNTVLAAGAKSYGFSVARPQLNPLCGVGPAEIQPVFLHNGTLNPYAFHPTQTGEYAEAYADYGFDRQWVTPQAFGG